MVRIDKSIARMRISIAGKDDLNYSLQRSPYWFLVFLGIVTVVISGCIRIPDQNWTISHRPPLETRRQVDDCSAACLTPSASPPVAALSATSFQTDPSAVIDSDGFSLVSWNMFKGRKRGWAEDFARLSRHTDILVLQEAYLAPRLKHLLHRHAYHWDMTTAFAYRQIEAGVLTASRIRPNLTCTFREKEPVTRIPKGVLITRYAMSGTNQHLLVANIHAINFTTNHSAFKKQNDRIESLLNAHPGPMIVAGDFNTWSKGRMSRVKAMTERLGLTAVKFDDNRTRVFGQSIDHVYYRGLESTYAQASTTTASDHNPLAVGFKRVEKNEAPET